MSIGIGIGNSLHKIPMASTLISGGGGIPLVLKDVVGWNVSNSLVSDIDATYPTIWSVAPGMNDDLVQQTGGWYPGVVSGEAGLMWIGPAFDIASDDMWLQWTVYTEFTGANDYMGMGLRMSQVTETYYGFWMEAASYAIFKVVAGVNTPLDTGVISVPSPGEVFRAEVEGTNLRLYRDDILIGSASDSDISTGIYGIIGDGIASGSRTKIADFRAGSIPYVLPTEWIAYFDTERTYNIPINDTAKLVTACAGSNTPEAALDNAVGSGWSHAANEQHYIEIDLLENIWVTGIATYGATTGSTYDWDDFDVYGKLLVTDGWTTLGTGLALDNPGAVGWKEANFSTSMAVRYIRIEINSTLDAGNSMAASEIVFLSGVPGP